ncbi:MAG: hypothetical protein EGQ63_09290, partial [Clostridiales bacterium]|nr:hypothetical protein [Clostridiales bacterium]
RAYMRGKKNKIMVGIYMGIFAIAMQGGGLYVRANESVKYQYDALGRVVSVYYSNGAEYEYKYDKNGNIVSVKKVKGKTTEKPDTTEELGKEETTKEPNTGKTTETTKEPDTEKKTETTKEPDMGKTTETTKATETSTTEKTTSVATEGGVEGPVSTTEAGTGEIQTEETSTWNQKELRQINRFRRKRPLIKSLSAHKKDEKVYMNIQIRQMLPLQEEGESGYQIRYAKNGRFKHYKNITVKRKVKGTITKRNWRIQKNKTYYVKVRAYRTLRTGKTIYSKYSKVRKIRIGK